MFPITVDLRATLKILELGEMRVTWSPIKENIFGASSHLVYVAILVLIVKENSVFDFNSSIQYIKIQP